MLNILIPLAGSNQFFKESEYLYPKPLIEINNKTMIEHVIDNLNQIKQDKQFIFILNTDDCKKYHIDNIVNILTDYKCQIIRIDNETKGAACSAALAIQYINNDFPLIVSNADQVINDDIENIISKFENYDAGVITFESVHPRWSYVRVDENNFVIETAEKRPFSKEALAGFFYFKKGKDFISSIMSMIKKDASVDGRFYVSPTLNEMVLVNKEIKIYKIDNDKYHTFYTPQKIHEYERLPK